MTETFIKLEQSGSEYDPEDIGQLPMGRAEAAHLHGYKGDQDLVENEDLNAPHFAENDQRRQRRTQWKTGPTQRYYKPEPPMHQKEENDKLGAQIERMTRPYLHQVQELQRTLEEQRKAHMADVKAFEEYRKMVCFRETAYAAVKAMYRRSPDHYSFHDAMAKLSVAFEVVKQCEMNEFRHSEVVRAVRKALTAHDSKSIDNLRRRMELLEDACEAAQSMRPLGLEDLPEI